MRTILLTWNPELWPDLDAAEFAADIAKRGSAKSRWSCGGSKNIHRGDRVFLLKQGAPPRGVIASGRVTRASYQGPHWDGSRKEAGDLAWYVKVEWDAMLDPDAHPPLDVATLNDSRLKGEWWTPYSSGTEVKNEVAVRALEELWAAHCGKKLVEHRLPAQPTKSEENPDWTRDEHIVVLDFYLSHRPNPPGKTSSAILTLSRTIRRLGEKLFSPAARLATFRNPNGIYMKLMNFRRLDPEYTAGGKKGLQQGAKGEEEVWIEFASDPRRCHEVSETIISSLDDRELDAPSDGAESLEGIEEAPEGRLLTRSHVVRERNRRLVESKRRQVLKDLGKLECEACGFDFAARYGDRGQGFIECHHKVPVAELKAGDKTHIKDLGVVCANCHRMIHRAKPWLTIEQVKALLLEGSR
ncbi:MAG: HNH endonuclease [Planctomycetota bacterium]